jgi:hypothetical protein
MESTKVTIRGIVPSNTTLTSVTTYIRILISLVLVIPEFPAKLDSVLSELFSSNQPKLSSFNEVGGHKLRSFRTAKIQQNLRLIRVIPSLSNHNRENLRFNPTLNARLHRLNFSTCLEGLTLQEPKPQ